MVSDGLAAVDAAKEVGATVVLGDGDLLVMGGDLQTTHVHEVMKARSKEASEQHGRRINITVRSFADASAAVTTTTAPTPAQTPAPMPAPSPAPTPAPASTPWRRGSLFWTRPTSLARSRPSSWAAGSDAFNFEFGRIFIYYWQLSDSNLTQINFCQKSSQFL